MAVLPDRRRMPALTAVLPDVAANSARRYAEQCLQCGMDCVGGVLGDETRDLY